MAKYLSKLTVSGTTYDIKDAKAWSDIEDIKSSITGAMHWLGYTTTALTDGATTNPIVIDGENVTAVSGDVTAIAGSGEGSAADKEFVFNGTKWQEYGSTGSLKALAFKDNASASYTPAGSNAASAVSFSGTTSETVLKAIDDAAVAPSFTEGAFSAGTLPSFTEGTFSAGTLPSFTEGAFTPATYSHSGFSGGSLGAATTDTFATEGVVASVDESNEILTFTSASTSSAVTAQGTFTAAVYGTDTFTGGSKAEDTWSAGTLPSKAADSFSAGTLPSKAADTFDAGSAATFTTETVITGLGTATAAAQTFTGTAATITVS